MTEHRDAATEAAALEHAREVLAAAREGILFIDAEHLPVRFVTEHDSGRLIASVPVATFFASQCMAFVPEEHDEALQLLLSAEEIQESAATDRWLAYHLGEAEHPEHTRWAAFWIDSAKHGPWVFDGDAFMTPNPMASIEPRVCKAVNERRDALAAATARATGADRTDGALCVGVDPGGLYVRLRHGVVRVPFPPADHDSRATIETVDHLIDRLLTADAGPGAAHAGDDA